VKNLHLDSYEKAMGGLACSQDDFMLKSFWTAWRLLAQEGKERRLNEMKEKAHRSEGAMKALGRFCKNDAQSLLRMVMGGRAYLYEERKRERSEEEKKRMKSTHLTQAEKALGSLANSSESVFLRSVFCAWLMDLTEAKNRRQMELEEKAKRSHIAMKSLMKFCQAEQTDGLRMYLGAWAYVLDMKRREEIENEKQKLLQMQRAQFQKTAGCLASNSERAVRQGAFLAWLEASNAAKEKRAAELEEKAKKSAVAMQSLAKFCESQSTGSLHTTFGAWWQTVQDARKEATRAEMMKVRAEQQAHHDLTLLAWASSDLKTFLEALYRVWVEVMRESRIRKELAFDSRMKVSGNAQKAMAKFMKAQTSGVAALYFGAWRFLLEEKAKEAMDREFHKLKLDHTALEHLLQDRVLRSLIGCRLGARFRTRLGRATFLVWLGTLHEGRVQHPLPRQEWSPGPGSGAYVKANKHTTVGALLASAQAQAQSRDTRARRAHAARLELE